MNQHLYRHALDGLDENLIEAHLESKHIFRARALRQKRMITASAACTALIAVGVGVGVIVNSANVEFDEPVHELGDVAIAKSYVTVHYLLPNGQLAKVRQYLSCDAQSIFAAWRTQNGLGEDVRLLHTHTASNGEESFEWMGEYEGAGEGVVGYRPGDKFTLTITVSGLTPYLADEDGEALLESLKWTLSGYTNLTYERVEVVLE